MRQNCRTGNPNEGLILSSFLHVSIVTNEILEVYFIQETSSFALMFICAECCVL